MANVSKYEVKNITFKNIAIKGSSEHAHVTNVSHTMLQICRARLIIGPLEPAYSHWALVPGCACTLITKARTCSRVKYDIFMQGSNVSCMDAPLQ